MRVHQRVFCNIKPKFIQGTHTVYIVLHNPCEHAGYTCQTQGMQCTIDHYVT